MEKPGTLSKIHHLPVLKKILMGGWVLLISSCSEAQNPDSDPSSDLYFPPLETSTWESAVPASLGWNEVELAKLLEWLPNQDTRAFIILKDGKIVVEKYWGNKLTGLGTMDQNSFWYWASAGKTLTAALVGIAQEEKLLSIDDRSDKYLGQGWTSLKPDQESEIKLIHQLTMTTGLDDRVENPDDTSPESLKYLAKPGSRWSYHNAAYTLLESILINASGKSYQTYCEERIGKKIGMKGFWQQTGLNNIYYSDARSFARFGLLLLAKGNWNGVKIWSSDYFISLSESSQKLNLSYGYLTWLNGKSSYMVPGPQTVIPGMLLPQAPPDMYQAMGKNGQFLMVIPSQNMVIVRMGGSGDNSLVPFLLIRDIWDKLNPILPNN